MITVNDVLRNLKKLIGEKDWDANDIYCAFEDFEENGETNIHIGKSDNNGYDYIAYIDKEGSTQFLISVNKVFNPETGELEYEIIEDVWIG